MDMYSSFHFLVLITCWVGQPTSISGSCITIGGGGDCVFPFTFEGVTYTGCLTYDDMNWCATKTDWRGIVKNWGRCDATCPMHGATTTTRADCKCGVKGSGGEDYIIGGEDTEENEYPWQVRLDVNESMLCGGTLISSTHVLTAAHCVVNIDTGIDYQASQIKVHLGEHNIDTTFGSDVAEVIKHSRYKLSADKLSADNDYAILRLPQPVSFTNSVSPACLPDNWKKTYNGVSATATGWGTTGSGRFATTTLQEADVRVISNAVCDNYYRNPVTKNMICTAGTGEGVCHGDSGGPLTVRENDRHAVIGVTSYGRYFTLPNGKKSCDVNVPAVFARVTEKMDWILANTRGTFSSTCKALN